MEIKVLQIIVLDVVIVESKIIRLIFFCVLIRKFLFRYKVVLDSDAKFFDGHGRINDKQEFFMANVMWDERQFSFKVNIFIRKKISFISYFRFIFQIVLYLFLL